ncbi:tyrosine-protein kinase Mer-like [Etheostoma spectabile]|uniref:tyrosine-protein kinase Mer-like n=1 Tax=Etheostoma spectabile TaxID=54343 RepID=UPI0013AFA511|nr:tyrosine-protein kinase Mer-like [Etheostoma spectabile]
MAKKSTPGWFGVFLSTTTIAIIVVSAQHSQGRFHRFTRASEPLGTPARILRVYLSKDQLRLLHFKPTIGSIQLSEGHEAKFNCSIDIPDARLEPTIVWVKNGQDLAGNIQVVINDLQTITDGVITLLSTVSISHVQRVDAGEYRCRLNISNTMVESQPITIMVEGLPTFLYQPEDRNVTRHTPFMLSCEAVGPPDPVRIRWLRDGSPDSDFHNSPSSYSVSGETPPTQSLSPSFPHIQRTCVATYNRYTPFLVFLAVLLTHYSE